jgi:Na+-transporting methylmalonyl-CoA/oxaloacetate decarboxylase gamma subunit
MGKAKKKSAIDNALTFAFKVIGGLALLFLFLVILGFALYSFSSSSSHQSNVIANSNVEIVKSIVEEYHQTHTYSQPDFFVCSDMAIDVWNMVKSKGINAQIEVGNIDNPNANFTEYNHAWVLAETEPLKWLALETTGGYVVYNSTNYLYYKGFSFNTPNEFKRYLEIRTEYNNQLELINKTQGEYNQCKVGYETLKLNYNQNYAGRPTTSDNIQARDQVTEKLGECNALNTRGMEEFQTLSNIVNELKGLIT